MPDSGLGRDFRRLADRMPKQERVHVLVQFTRIPNAGERRGLDSAGVHLLDPVPDNGFFAAIPTGLDFARALVARPALRIRSIEAIRPDDKIAPSLKDSLPTHVRRPDGRAELIVEFFGDVPPAVQERVLEGHGAQVIARIEPINGWHIALEATRIGALAGEDPVKWIADYPPPPTVDNDGVRGATGLNADAVLVPTAYNLSGNGVTAAQWEPTTPSAVHADFGGRVAIADPPPSVNSRTHAHDESVTANGQYDNGEGIYRDLDDSRTVTAGDVRVTAAGGFGAGTTVAAGDGDLGTVLAFFGFRETFADAPPPDAIYVAGEPIYRDQDNSFSVSAGDLRITGGGAFAAGTVVAAGDADEGQALWSFPTNPHYHSTHVAGTLLGSGAQSAANGGAANQWKGVASGAVLRSYDTGNRFPEYTDAANNAVVISTNSWGTSHCHQVSPPNTCYNVESEFWDAVISGIRSDGTPSGLVRRIQILGSAGNQGRPERHTENITANGRFDAGEAIYLDADDDGVVSGADGPPRAGPAQALGTVLVNFNLNEMHDETVNPFGTYNAGEGIYLDADGSRTVTAGDTRITAVGAFAAGSIVAVGDADAARFLRQFKLWGNVRIPNSAKNSIEVANVTSDDMRLSASSSRGPTDDGRTKPDLAAPGDETGGEGGVKSTFPGNLYWVLGGTSMATPAVSGVAALLTEWHRSACVAAGPTPDVLKALLIHGAEDLSVLPNVGAFPGPDFAFGFGRTRAKEAAGLLANHLTGTATGLGSTDVTVTVGRQQPLRVTLVWNDPAWTSVAAPSPATGVLQNDLDLVLIGPDGTQYTPWLPNGANPFAPATRGVFPAATAIPLTAWDRRNTVEQVVVDDAMPGTWTIRLIASALKLPPQPYTLVSEALPPQMGPCATTPAADVWMRDNDTDVGTVPSSGQMWLGPDLWNRLAADGLTDHQNPEYGQPNHLYANIRNTAAAPVALTTIEVWVGAAALGLIWPDNFSYAGRFSVPNLAPGEVRQVGPLEWNPPSPTPSSHFCLYMRVLSAQDPITFAEGPNIWTNAMNSNNIAYRNITIVDLSSSRSVTFLARNVDAQEGEVDVVVQVPPAFLQSGDVRLDLSPELDRRWPAQNRLAPGLVALEQYRVAGAPGVARPDTTEPQEELRPPPYRVTARQVVLRGFRLKPKEAGRLTLTFSSGQRAPATYQVDVIQQVRGEPVGGIRFIVRTGRGARR